MNVFSVIDKPVDIVFNEVSDLRNEPSYNPNMLSVVLLTNEPISKNAEFNTTVKSGGFCQQLERPFR